MNDLKGNGHGRLVCLIGFILVFGTLACYWPACHFTFFNLDDPLYVFQNQMVRLGLSWRGMIWAFNTVEVGNWNPLVWLSHMVDCQIYGLNPGGHHVTNVVLHMANGLLLFLALRNMTGAVWRSAFAAAIFAWHPMHVESVAWISERKDVLSTLFLILTIWTYAGYARNLKLQISKFRFCYAASLFLFALGLMCKPMLVTVPLVLLLLDYWPLQRQEQPGRLVIEKLPFLALSAAASALAVWAQQSAGAAWSVPLAVRLENALVSYAVYIEKFFWPVDLAICYPYPISIPIWQWGGAALMLGAVSAAVIGGMKKRHYLGVGWFWFLGTLVPVIGLVQVGTQAMADRYSYIPHVGLALMVSWGLADLAAAWPGALHPLAGLAVAALGGCLVATRTQVKYWRDSMTLYQHALQVTADNYLAHKYMALMLVGDGKLDEALRHFQEVIRIHPGFADIYNDIGKVYAAQGKLDGAMAMFAKAITINPDFAQAHFDLGNALILKGQIPAAVDELKTDLRLKPDDIEAQRNLAGALIRMGRTAEALPYCEAVAQARPDDAQAHFAFGEVCLAEKRPEEAVANFRKTLRLAPDTADCMNALAWIYATCPNAKLRDGLEAVRLATKACKLTQPTKPGMLDTLAAAYAEAGRFPDAINTAEAVRALAIAAHDTGLAEMAHARLKLYKAGKPFRDE